MPSHSSGERADLAQLAAAVRKEHEHVVVGTVNDHIVKIAVNEVPYGWHRHPNSDEFFLVMEGALTVEFEDGSRTTLNPDDGLILPAGVVHRTIPQGRTVNLLVERRETETEFVEGGAG